MTAIREVGGEVEVDAGGATHRAGRVVVAADAWTNELLAPFGRRLPLTVTKEQVTYFAAPDPAAFAPGPLPGLDLDGRAVVLRLPDLRRGRARRPPRTAAASRRRRRRGPSSATRRPTRASADVHGRATCRAPLGPDIYTKTCLYTLTPGPRLRRRPAARGAGRHRPPRARRTGSSTPRSSGRIAAELEPRRRDAVGGRARARSGSTGRSCSRTSPDDLLDGLSPRGRGASSEPVLARRRRPVPTYPRTRAGGPFRRRLD